jgi:hypothetical protein
MNFHRQTNYFSGQVVFAFHNFILKILFILSKVI